MNSELVISIHALVKRATARLLSQIYFMRYFNPRPRKEGDLQIRSGEEAEAYFNPRPRKEGDQCKILKRNCANLFQSTPA